MNIFFDDSGDFSLPKNTENKISLWVGVTIPEICFDRIKKNYLNWEASALSNLEVNELKGKLLDDTRRMQFFDVIKNENDILIQPGILDLQIQKKYMPSDLSAVMRGIGIDVSERMKSEKDQNILGLHGRRLGNLSAEQLLKFMTLTFCIIETLRHSIMFRSHANLRECWREVIILIDKSSKQKRSRDELVLWDSIGWALHNITKRNPFELIEGIHDQTHPFIMNYDSPAGINGKKLFQNLHFEKSENSWGLRFADIMANTLYQALNDLENTSGALPYYKKIMKYSPLGPNSNLGFTCIVGSDELNNQIKASRFAILQHILNSEPDS